MSVDAHTNGDGTVDADGTTNATPAESTTEPAYQ